MESLPCSQKTMTVELFGEPHLFLEQMPDRVVAMHVSSLLDLLGIEPPGHALPLFQWVMRDREPELDALDAALAPVGWDRQKLEVFEAFSEAMVREYLVPVDCVMELVLAYRRLWREKNLTDPVLQARGLRCAEAWRQLKRDVRFLLGHGD